jgi:DNA-binding CsgD family transcriptional regulator
MQSRCNAPSRPSGVCIQDIRHLPDGSFNPRLMQYDEARSDRRLRILLAVVLLLAMTGGAIDLVLDAPESPLSFHLIYEITLIAAEMTVFFLLWRAWFKAEHEVTSVKAELETQRAERDAWRASAESALAGFGSAVEQRFAGWGLTPAEKEIALLLLKGRSHKEIAYTTNRSERTVRQHAVTIYQKSHLGGRAELAAFFLDDLSLPRANRQE